MPIRGRLKASPNSNWLRLAVLSLALLLIGAGCGRLAVHSVERPQEAAQTISAKVGEAVSWGGVRLVLQEATVAAETDGRRLIRIRLQATNESKEPERISGKGTYQLPGGKEGYIFFFRGDQFPWQGRLAPGEETEQQVLWEVPAETEAIHLLFDARGWANRMVAYQVDTHP